MECLQYANEMQTQNESPEETIANCVLSGFKKAHIAVQGLMISPQGDCVVIMAELLGIRRQPGGSQWMRSEEDEFQRRMSRVLPNSSGFRFHICSDDAGKKWKKFIRFEIPSRFVLQRCDVPQIWFDPGIRRDMGCGSNIFEGTV